MIKLPGLRRKHTVKFTADSPEPKGQAKPGLPDGVTFEMLAYARTGLPDKEFNAQTEALRQIFFYDGETRSWYTSLPVKQPERTAEILTAALMAARVHGTTILVRAHPATAASLPALPDTA